MDTQQHNTSSATDGRNATLRTLAQLGPRLTDDVIGIHIDDDGLRIHSSTREHAVEIAYLVAAADVQTKHGTYIQPWNGAEHTSVRTTWTSDRNRVTVLHIEQTPTGRVREVCCEQGIYAEPVGTAAVVPA